MKQPKTYELCAMRIRIKVEGLEGYLDVDIPEDHKFIEWACEKRDEGGTVGWDAVAAFEGAIRDCIVEEMTVDIIPPAHLSGGEAVCSVPTTEHDKAHQD